MPAESSPFESLRLAIVGAASLLGKEVAAQLAASGFPADAVTLFDLEEVAGVLTEYGEEARVFAETVAENVLRHDLVCFCGDPAAAADYLEPIRESGKLGIDCTGAWLAEPDICAWIPGVSAAPSINDHRLIAMPPAACLMLGSIVAALGDAAEQAAATVFAPASDLDEAGLRELSQQSTAVLNLEEIDVDVFGRQLAFDLWPAGAERQGATSVATMLEGLGLTVPALQLVSAPVFHGMAMSMFLPQGDTDVVCAALQDAGIAVSTNGDTPIDSPVRVTGKPGLHAIDVRADRHGVWLWVSIDNLHARAAATVAAIRTISGPAVSDALQ